MTCVYRLARLYTGIRHPEQRQAWKNELNESPAFQVLLRKLVYYIRYLQRSLRCGIRRKVCLPDPDISCMTKSGVALLLPFFQAPSSPTCLRRSCTLPTARRSRASTRAASPTSFGRWSSWTWPWRRAALATTSSSASPPLSCASSASPARRCAYTNPALSPHLCKVMEPDQASVLQQPSVNFVVLLPVLAGPGQPAVGLRQAGRAPRGGHLSHHGADDGDAEPRPVRQPV